MKSFLRLTAYAAVTLTTVVALVAAWFLGSKGGLPHVDALRAYAPARDVLINPQSCRNQIRAISSSDLGLILPLIDSTEDHVATQIARTIFCDDPHPHFDRPVREIRLALQLRVRFNKRDLQAIYLNRVYVGDQQYGMEDGAQHYFGTHASELTLDQAALLVGLIQSPSRYSPYKHPDRALGRRNAILQKYSLIHTAEKTSIEAAIAAPLGVKPAIASL